ncbi:MAG TPA: tetratricopeptide repeat protein [Candidatus Polarisedimenticolia bacterium]|nr:tetratricopeptide repeat protein [Candidatus Polarisedimenticolia bacterium]
MPDRRSWLLFLGIPGLLLYATFGVAQLRSAHALAEFKALQKAYPPDSLKVPPPEIQARKMGALLLAERLAPDNPEPAFQLGLLHMVKAEVDSFNPAPSEGDAEKRTQASLREGLRWIDRAIERNPGDAEVHFVKATLLQNLDGSVGEENSATSQEVHHLLRLADRLDPYRPGLHFRIGSFWISLGEKDEARRALTVALSDTFRFARPVFNLLWSVVADADELADFVGDEPLSRAMLGDFLWMHGYREQAQEQFDKVGASPSFDYRTGESLIVHYLREYQAEKARGVIARMERFEPKLAPFYRARLELFRGKAYAQESRFQDAIPCYESSLALDPANVQSHIELAEAYLQEGQPQKAIARLRFVLSRSLPVPRDIAAPGEIHYSLGRAYEALGDREGALAEYLRASSEDPGNALFSEKATTLTRGL